MAYYADWSYDPTFRDRFAADALDPLPELQAWLESLGLQEGDAAQIAGQMSLAAVLRCGVPMHSSVESPIEALFLLAAYPYKFTHGLTILPQHQFGPYRVDFLMLNVNAASGELVVELDGHDFHERTKEQAERDKKRDRWFTSQGIRVVRFTGSEVWRDPKACAAEAVALLEGDR
jgi:very-short-patch-repair endonuclease